jgi:type I restriction enzyme S subunit
MNIVEKLIEENCPDGIKYSNLGDLGNFYGGLTGKDKNFFVDGNAKYITYMNIFSNIEVDLNINNFVSISENERQNQVNYGDVLFTTSSETPDECGMSSVVTKNLTEPIYLNSFCFGFRLHNPTIFLPGFLKYLFRNENLRQQISKQQTGLQDLIYQKKDLPKL